jgi:hypothetical protein
MSDTETTTTAEPAAAATDNSAAALGGAHRVFQDGVEVGASEVPAEKPPTAPAFTKEDQPALSAIAARSEGDATEEGEGDGEEDADAEAVEDATGEQEDAVGDADPDADEAEATDTDAEDDEAAEPDADEYSLPAVEGFEWTPEDEAAAAPFIDIFKEGGDAREVADKVFSRYAELRRAVDARDRAAVKEARAALEQEWGAENYRANISALDKFLGDATRIPPALARQIITARATDGSRIVNQPAFALLLHRLAQSQPRDAKQTAQPTQKDALADELADIDALLERDADEYSNRTWRRTGKPASERRLEILRTQAKRGEAPRTELAADEAEELDSLEKLMSTDISKYMHEPWQKSGKTGERRYYELTKKRAGAR